MVRGCTCTQGYTAASPPVAVAVDLVVPFLYEDKYNDETSHFPMILIPFNLQS